MHADHETATAHDQHWPACTVCHRELRQDEFDRRACYPCTQRVDQDLAALAGPRGLYAQLGDALIPGQSHSDDARVATSRTHAPLPIRLDPLSLTAKGGVVTVLQQWATIWHQQMGRPYPAPRGPLQQQLDEVVATLRFNLDWAAHALEAFDTFATEIRQYVGECRRTTTGERPERRITVTCYCGGRIPVTISTRGAACNSCGTVFDRDRVLSLPLATRTHAAA